jgi:hypothetical protein
MRVLRVYNLRIEDLDNMTPRQIVYLWSAIERFNREEIAIQAIAARLAQIEDSRKFEDEINKLRV